MADRLRRAIVAATVCLAAAGCAGSQSNDAGQGESSLPQPTGELPVTAPQILASVARRYAQMKSIRVDVSETMSLARTESQDLPSQRTVAVLARPNRFSLPGGDVSSVSFHADGDQMWTVLGDRFAQCACPADMSSMVDDPEWNPLMQLSSQFLLKLFSDDAQAAITRDAGSTVLLDDQWLEGRLMHRVKLTQDDFDWELWVAAEAPGLIQQIVVDLSKQLGSGPAGAEGTRINNTIRFENWEIDPPLDEAGFRFLPGSGLRRVEHVMRIGR